MMRKIFKYLLLLMLCCTTSYSNDVAAPDPSTTPTAGDEGGLQFLGIPLYILVTMSVAGLVVSTTVLVCVVITIAYLCKRKKGRTENVEMGERGPSDSTSSYDSASSYETE